MFAGQGEASHEKRTILKPDNDRLTQHPDHFVNRHIGPGQDDIDAMLAVLGHESLDAMINAGTPSSIRLSKPPALPRTQGEIEALQSLRRLADQNQVYRSYIGMGYYDTITPNVILRNLLENPGWYTAYTPYQAEVSQGRLEALLNYQQMVMDLTGMDIANASLLDEATAAAEAMAFSRRISRSKSMKFFASEDCHPQTLDVLKTRAEPMGIELVLGTPEENLETEFFGVLLQYPSTTGVIHDIGKWIEQWHQNLKKTLILTDFLILNWE